MGYDGLTRRTFSSAMNLSIRECVRQSYSSRRIPVCLQERCGIRIARGPEYDELRDLG